MIRWTAGNKRYTLSLVRVIAILIGLMLFSVVGIVIIEEAVAISNIQWYEYEVQQGDYLIHLAADNDAWYHVDTTKSKIKRYNNMEDSKLIAGELIWLPKRQEKTYE